VQIAKALGAEVTAVCSTGNVDLVPSIGADHVVDYTREDFTRSGRRYDLLFDNAGSRSWSECKRVLEPHATVVLVGGQMGNRLFGPLGHVIRMRLAALGSGRKAVFFVAQFNKPDLGALRELLEAGKVTPVADRQYELDQVADAFRYMGAGHARKKQKPTDEATSRATSPSTNRLTRNLSMRCRLRWSRSRRKSFAS
jgi:NADPH:quinone reductase-like Zn-dependent oxidoreductase